MRLHDRDINERGFPGCSRWSIGGIMMELAGFVDGPESVRCTEGNSAQRARKIVREGSCTASKSFHLGHRFGPRRVESSCLTRGHGEERRMLVQVIMTLRLPLLPLVDHPFTPRHATQCRLDLPHRRVLRWLTSCIHKISLLESVSRKFGSFRLLFHPLLLQASYSFSSSFLHIVLSSPYRTRG